jgi:hypothetical protein
MQLSGGRFGSALARRGIGKQRYCAAASEFRADVNMQLSRGIYGSALAAAAHGKAIKTLYSSF